jgi:hypothetical protein
MKVVKNDKIVFFDLDFTLIKPFPADYEEHIHEVDHFGSYKFVPIESNIKALRQLKEADYEVYVWSHAGAELASKVIKELGLEHDVDCVFSKPLMVFDDQYISIPPATKHVFLDEDGNNIMEAQPLTPVVG